MADAHINWLGRHMKSLKPIDIVLLVYCLLMIPTIALLVFQAFSAVHKEESALLIIGTIVVLVLLICAKRSSRSSLFHWALLAILCVVIAETADEVGRIAHPLLTISVEVLVGLLIIADLIFNEDIGRPPRKSFRALIQEGTAEIILSLAALLALGLFYGAARRLGSTQYTLMLIILGIMLYMVSRSDKSQNPTTAILGLLIGAGWNIAASVYALSVAQPGWLATLFAACCFLTTAYRLRRCPLPDLEEKGRPTRGLKRTPDGAA